MEWKTLEAHPAADMFPLMVGSDLQSLASSIKKSKQLFPVIVGKDGKVWDGRNRLAAHRLSTLEGWEPWIETYNGDLNAIDYVRAVNWERMHLNQSERARLAVLLSADAKREAKERQLSGKTVAAGEVKGPSADIVAKKMGVSRTQVERAERIRREAPEAFELLGKGTTVRAEYAKLPKKSRTEVRHGSEAKLAEAMSRTFAAGSAFESVLTVLRLDQMDIPPMNAEQRSRYLDGALQLQKRLQSRLNDVIRKLQG
jgi:ParB-like chromosome segregation protein Spo0J